MYWQPNVELIYSGIGSDHTNQVLAGLYYRYQFICDRPISANCFIDRALLFSSAVGLLSLVLIKTGWSIFLWKLIFQSHCAKTAAEKYRVYNRSQSRVFGAIVTIASTGLLFWVANARAAVVAGCGRSCDLTVAVGCRYGLYIAVALITAMSVAVTV